MAFKFDYSEVKEFQELQEGFYEVVCQSAEEKETNNGKKYIQLDLVVRNDVNQSGQNLHHWHSMFRMKDGRYHQGVLMGLGSSFGISDQKEFNTFEDMLREFHGKAAKMKLRKETYNGETNLRVHYFNKTAFPQINHKWKEMVPSNSFPSHASEMPIDVSDDDLPF
ncbi:MAG: DUF669 domain-containing protein [Streptococcaceae bacterium]|jgi:hypothetical protein|nr:DUF669 domain-containing protein [Streptococcaceae bacterium]